MLFIKILIIFDFIIYFVHYLSFIYVYLIIVILYYLNLNMQVKEISLEGFKSYKYKTIIQGFDKNFNAITGLNGSGKSNILDAICFLMGMSTVSNMRISNLQELIYQNAKSEIKRATVSITFTNTSNSPFYSDYGDEIIISRSIYEGKSKFLINGKNQSLDNIKKVFQESNLNINNPHFLIMQGKVTKVVNMSPLDILSLLEEASGTKIYETNKENSIKTMNKKQNKLNEIERYLVEVITPKLQQLYNDRKSFLQWKDNENIISRLQKIVVAYDYWKITNEIENENTIRNNLTSNISQETSLINELNISLTNTNNNINNLESNTNNKIIKELNSIDEEINKEKKLVNTKYININKLKEILDKNTTEKANYIYKLKSLEQERNLNDKKIKNNQNTLDQLNLADENNKEILKKIELELNNKNNKDKKNNNFNKKNIVEDIENHLSNTNNNNLKKLIISINTSKDQAFSLETKKENIYKYLNENNKKLENLEIEKERLKNKKTENYKRIHFINNQFLNKDVINKLFADNNEIDYKSIANSLCNEIRSKIKDLEDNKNSVISILEKNKFSINEIYNKIRNLNLVYNNPESNFDRSKVKGRVLNLFKLNDKKYAKALEKIAGLKLFNIVVDNNLTASALLNNRSFKTMETFLPLNQIKPFNVDKNKRNKIKDLFSKENKAFYAPDLIDYNSIYSNIISFVFGNSFVCTSNEVAKKLAYSNEFRVRCVNLEGDLYDPNGVLTGGFAGNFPSTIIINEELNKLNTQCTELNNQIDNKEKEIIMLNEKLDVLNNSITNLENIDKEIEQVDEDKIKQNIVNFNFELKETEQNLAILSQKIEELEKEKIDLENIIKKDSKVNDKINKNNKREKSEEQKIEEYISLIKLKLEDNKVKSNNITKDIIKLKSELDKNNKEIEEINTFINTEKSDNNKTKEDIDILKIQIENIKEKINILEGKLNIKRKEESINAKELDKLYSLKESIEKDIKEHTDNLKNLEYKISELEYNSKDNKEKIIKMEKTYHWIAKEKNLFVEINNNQNINTNNNNDKNNLTILDHDYNFSKYNIQEEKLKLKNLIEDNKVLEKNVNMKVDALAEEFEKEYNLLIEKKKTLYTDKVKYEKSILELDKKRKDSVLDVFNFVNKKFNNIYKSFLPGATAKLIQTDNDNILKGLEMKVAFNNTWKNSLSELSGGQRSLLALSFILSLLCYKPASFYILDEIDAALDLSHTANLGLMIKDHFPQSQFIIISLKDGMFNNANVLYKVSYNDGSSRVQRIVKELKEDNFEKIININKYKNFNDNN